MIQTIFIGFVALATLFFVLLLFSILGKPPGEEVRHRMEQYIVETEMVAEQYSAPEEDDEVKKAVDASDDDWVKENRAGGSAAKRILANMGTIITPKGMAMRIADQLAKADIPLKANEFVAIQFLAIMLSLSFGMGVMQNVLVAIGLAAVGYVGPLIWISVMKSQRVKAFNEQILDTLVMLANGLKAGYSFLQSLEMVSRETLPPMGKELKRVLKENSLGINLEDTLVALNQRVESEDWDLVTTVVLIQRQIGGNLAEILDKIGYTIRQRMKIKGEIQTKTAQAKISGIIVGALPLFLGMMIYVVNPEFIMKLFTFRYGEFRGWFVVIAGVIWELIGLYAIMCIVDIEV